MDIYSLTATHIRSPASPAPATLQAEDRYYAAHAGPPRLRTGLLGSLAMVAGLVLILTLV